MEMFAGIVGFVTVYVLIGLLISATMFGMDYAALCAFFWPVMIIVKLIIDIKEFIEDLIDGTLF